MGYADEMLAYINKDTGMFGLTPNDANYSTGNMLLDYGTAMVFLDKLAPFDFTNYENTYVDAVQLCKITPYFYSSAPATLKRISHDDVIGLAAGLSKVGGAKLITEYGTKHCWLLSTDGNIYWDATSKPWHVAYYVLASGGRPGVLGIGFLSLYVILDALFNKSNSSDKKLVWLMLKTVEGKSKVIDLVAKFWNYRLRKVWGSMKQVFKVYHGESHLFTKYCWE